MLWVLLLVWLSLPIAVSAYFVYVDYFGPPTAEYERVPPLLAFLLALGWPIFAAAIVGWFLLSLLFPDD